MDSDGRRIIVWTGATSGLNYLAVESLLMDIAHPYESSEKIKRLSLDGAKDRRGSTGSSNSSSRSSLAELQRLRLILALRDPSSENTQRAMERFQSLAFLSGSIVEGIECDLASFKNVRTFASKITEKYPDISTVVLGAAIYCWGPPSFTDLDRCEMGMTVNHLSQWLLVALLRTHIRNRVVFVGSSLYRTADLTGIMKASKKKSSSTVSTKEISYAATKALQAVCLEGWEKIFRSQGVDVLMCTPGFVPSTDLKRHTPIYMQFLMHHVVSKLWFTTSPEHGASIIKRSVTSSAYNGKTNVCINKHKKVERLNFQRLQTDMYEVMASPKPSTPPPTLNNQVPLSENADFVDALLTSDVESRASERLAYWNWTCAVVKERELMMGETNTGCWDEYSI